MDVQLGRPVGQQRSTSTGPVSAVTVTFSAFPNVLRPDEGWR
ncbi:MAG TPA: hypothetical protein VM261_23270 [Kofleriaceae bacterium]|nr:hypothetical protein [Kofleriaceae bacterium]